MKKVIIYTDGSCLGNPGPGAWAAILTLAGTTYRKEISGGFRRTTNNRMEIMAAIEGLAALNEPCEVEARSDSRYVCDAVEKGWLASWRRGGWRKADKKPVLNADLWRKLAALLEIHNARFLWVKGHDGDEENERCDVIARSLAATADLPPDEEYERAETGAKVE